MIIARNITLGKILNNVSLSAEKGEVLAIVGKAEDGRNALMDILAGVADADKGTVEVCGASMNDAPSMAKSHLGYSPAQPALYPDMTGRGYLKFVGSTHEMAQRKLNDNIIKALNLLSVSAQDADEPMKFLPESIGRRLSFAQAILNDPDVLLADSGCEEMDAQSVTVLRKAVREYAKEHAVVLATENLTEAAQCADCIAILANGRIVAQGKKEELPFLTRGDGIVRITAQGSAEQVKAALANISGIEVTETLEMGETTMVTVDQKGTDLRGAISCALCGAGAAVLSMQGVIGSLDDILLALHVDSRVTEREGAAE